MEFVPLRSKSSIIKHFQTSQHYNEDPEWRSELQNKPTGSGRVEPTEQKQDIDKDLKKVSFVSVASRSLQVGDRIEAKFRGHGKRFYAGEIKQVHHDGTFDVEYDDGDKDLRLSAGFIKKIPISSEDSQVSTPPEAIVIENQETSISLTGNSSVIVEHEFKVGDRVEAKYRGRGSRWYKGSILKCQTGGKYSVSYDDGDEDKSLPGEFIQPIVIPDSIEYSRTEVERGSYDAVGKDIFQVGDRVEARFRGKAKRYYQGSIKTAHSDGTYDVDYDDGDSDHRLDSAAIRAIHLREGPELDLDNTSNERSENSYATTNADVIELNNVQNVPVAQVGEKRRTSVSSNRTSIGSGIRSIDFQTDESRRSNGEGFNSGDNIEALFRGRGSRWYRGTIISRLPNGCYNIRYDYGDHDMNLPAQAVRAIHRPRSGTKSSVYADSGSKHGTEDEVRVEQTCPPNAGNHAMGEIEGSSTVHIEIDQTATTPGGNDPTIKSIDEDLLFVLENTHINSKGMELIESRQDSCRAPLDSCIISNSYEQELESMNNQPTSAMKMLCDGKGNKFYRGVVSNIKVIRLYEISYPDGTIDVNIPGDALRLKDKSSYSEISIGSGVDVLSWQDRFPYLQ